MAAIQEDYHKNSWSKMITKAPLHQKKPIMSFLRFIYIRPGMAANLAMVQSHLT